MEASARSAGPADFGRDQEDCWAEMHDRPVARLAHATDAPEIARICAAGWRDTYAGRHPHSYIEEVISEFYAPARIASESGPAGDAWGGYVVAELGGEILVAGAGGLISPEEGEIFVLYADPASRRRGGGRAVLCFITDQQRQWGAREQWVSVDPANDLGLSFYRAQGFSERGRLPAYRGDGESLRLARRI
jgi:ribosomal protein S18 acetylase RimI-like enzyme